MIPKPTFTENWRSGLAGAVSAVLLGLFFLVTPLGRGLEDLSYDLAFAFRAPAPVDEVLLIYMDLESHQKLGQKRLQAWDRSKHAQLLQRLKACGAKAVVFDVLFVENGESDPQADAALVQAASAFGKVVVAGKVTPDLLQGEIIGWQLTTPFAALKTNVAWGVVEVAEEDKFVRQHYFRRDFNAPSMAWKAAELTTTNPPPDPYQARWINYYGPPGWLPSYPYHQALETNGPGARAFAQSVSNKVVFVGALYSVGHTGGKGTDDFRTPYTRWTGRRSPGVEINATAYLNFAHRDWLTRMPTWAEVLLISLLGALAGFGLTRCRPLSALGWGALGALLVGAASIAWTWQTHVWFPWLIVAGVQLPCAVGWAVLAHATRSARERDWLERRLALVQAGAEIPGPPSPPLPAPHMSSGDGRSPLGASGAFWRKTPSGAPAIGSGGTLLVNEDQPQVPDHTMLRCIGQGAYGTVWLARDAIGSFHAVKIVRRDRFDADEPYEREFNGLKRFTPISRSHPGFVHVLHVGRNDAAGYMYYVMEAGDDETTGQKIDPEKYSPKNLSKEIKKRGRLPVAECAALIASLASALEHLHQQRLIHRDIKPSNIIFVNGEPKFADIGLVTDLAATGTDASYVGTAPYIPPEGPGSPGGDIYGLGKVLYEAGLGMKAAEFPALPTIMSEHSDQPELFQLNTIIVKACETDPRLRYQSAAELREDLLRLKERLSH